MKLLLVDDDEMILDLVGQYFGLTSGCVVEKALSAERALEVIADAQEPFDALLVDIQMPDVDGITLTKWVRNTPGYETTPIIMLTAMRDKSYLDRSFSAGATDYVTKPIDFMDLQRRLSSIQHLRSEQAKQQREPLNGGKEGKDLIEDPNTLALDDPIALPDVDAAIAYAEFDNYVRQLLRWRWSRTSAFAVHIASVGEVHAKLRPDEFKTLLRDVAFSIQHVFLADGGVLSYRGNGLFVCLPGKDPQRSRGDLETDLNRLHHTRFRPNGRIGIFLRVGEPVLLRRSSDVDALGSLALAAGS